LIISACRATESRRDRRQEYLRIEHWSKARPAFCLQFLVFHGRKLGAIAQNRCWRSFGEVLDDRAEAPAPGRQSRPPMIRITRDDSGRQTGRPLFGSVPSEWRIDFLPASEPGQRHRRHDHE